MQGDKVRKSYATCGAKTRCGTPCKRPAGWGTDHNGEGRCSYHGGRAGRPITHGLYSKIKRESLRELIEEYEATPDPLDVLPELAVLRALLRDYIERQKDGFGDPIPAAKLISEISKVVARIEKVKSDNHVTRADLCRIMQEMGRTVDRYVSDNSTKEKIRDDWLSIRL